MADPLFFCLDAALSGERGQGVSLFSGGEGAAPDDSSPGASGAFQLLLSQAVMGYVSKGEGKTTSVDQKAEASFSEVTPGFAGDTWFPKSLGAAFLRWALLRGDRYDLAMRANGGDEEAGVAMDALAEGSEGGLSTDLSDPSAESLISPHQVEIPGEAIGPTSKAFKGVDMASLNHLAEELSRTPVEGETSGPSGGKPAAPLPEEDSVDRKISLFLEALEAARSGGAIRLGLGGLGEVDRPGLNRLVGDLTDAKLSAPCAEPGEATAAVHGGVSADSSKSPVERAGEAQVPAGGPEEVGWWVKRAPEERMVQGLDRWRGGREEVLPDQATIQPEVRHHALGVAGQRIDTQESSPGVVRPHGSGGQYTWRLGSSGESALGDGLVRVFQAASLSRRATVVVEPPSLGRLEVHLDMKGAEVSARIRVDNQELLGLVEAQSQRLKESLEAQGLQVSGLSVDIRDRQGRSDGERRDRGKSSPRWEKDLYEAEGPIFRVDLNEGLLHWLA